MAGETAWLRHVKTDASSRERAGTPSAIYTSDQLEELVVTRPLGDLADRVGDVAHHRRDEPFVVAFGHHADHRLGPGLTDHQPPPCPEARPALGDDLGN